MKLLDNIEGENKKLRMKEIKYIGLGTDGHGLKNYETKEATNCRDEVLFKAV
jgi:hypothetical protein